MSIKINNLVWNKNNSDGCEYCQNRQADVAEKVIELLNYIGCNTLFVTKNDRWNELTLYTGETNLGDEFDCTCIE